MEELELCMTGIAWEWGMTGLDDDEDGGKDWVPMTLRMLATAGNRLSISTVQPRDEPMTLSHCMAVYAIKLSWSGGIVQAKKLTHKVMCTPQMQGETKDVNESDLQVFPHLYFLIYSMSFTLKIMK